MCVPELKEAAERAQAQYRSEKQRRKEMELRVNNMEEEVQDLKTDKDSLERVCPLSVCVHRFSSVRTESESKMMCSRTN